MKLAIYLYLTGYAMCVILWTIGLWTLVSLAKDIIKPRQLYDDTQTPTY